ncbi:hypothetical protein CC85DRAFT_305607 [Cutaneotrichosporon oleaginosum]|uniref:Zn(2)-C6 fungal-type domain-containing protein n=1 Tax=Cutaneotrichosporon oleaginosum TaxID=879819 RepID=A0A0J0XCL7_9TREE|nr:uncharacterized protein CC85DRAFT_305607 [Cutaneotrichosporon oleaginosum]KLT38823.1 hypothetical protein CC85DRAFT_305607 [Cutaneotrichosporon oleaginosum]TXT04732.1 hypothetical protein COLE_07551 [Cutaneotrichosporon oleaginosum]
MANEDLTTARGEQRDGGGLRPPPPLQPRTRSPNPKALDAAKADAAVRQPSPLSHTPVRPAIVRNPSSIAYGQTMYGVGVVGDVAPLSAPRPKPDLDKEELTTKGRKRKRLAKACSACHKNKRRCDGFAPCSNCEFSARPCIYLNAQGEQIPPPRTRDSSATPLNKRSSEDNGKPAAAAAAAAYLDRPSAATNGGSPEGWRRDYHEAAAAGTDMREWRTSGEHRSAPFGPIEVVERDPALQTELLDIAFRRTPAYACMFHAPTFHHRWYLNRVQPFLLDALYALGARLCDNPAFVKAYPPDTPTHKRGLVFADRCRANLDHVIEVRQRWSDEERKMDQGTWEETEFVQSCVLLSMLYNSNREARLGFYYLDVAVAVMRPGTNGQLHPPSPRLNLNTSEFFTMAEIRNRTLWLIVLQDICAVASGHPRRLSDPEIAHIPLPGAEMYWQRFGGMAANGREPGRRDTITVGSGNWHSEEGQVGELGHIVRILIIFANIMTFVNSGGANPMFGHSFETALKAWATDLPRNLRFDEVNLPLMMPKIKSPVAAVAFSGWAFAYMHAVAECGMFYLQSKQGGSPTAVQRQGSAVDNLTVLIDALGERGREGPLMFFPIMIVTCWMDHLHATSPTSSQQILEERLNLWWNELYREWGWERRETLKRGIFPNLEDRSPKSASPQPVNRGRTVAEGPQHASSPHQPESSASSAASQAVVTPSEPMFSRFPVLPPLRPRDRNESPRRGRSQSPRRGHRALGSIGSAGSMEREREEHHKRDGFNLPPLSSFRSSREGSREPRPLAPPSKRWAGPSGSQLLGIEALVSAAEEHRRESLEQPSAMA